jgi:hypothetical protein
LEDRRNVGENSCNCGDGTDGTGLILDVYDNDDDYRKMLKGRFGFIIFLIYP